MKKNRKNTTKRLKARKKIAKLKRSPLITRKIKPSTLKRKKWKNYSNSSKKRRKPKRVILKRVKKKFVVNLKIKTKKSKKRIRFSKILRVKPNKKRIVKKARVNTKIKKELRETKVKTPSLITESFKPNIRVIGIGGGGGSIVSEIGRSLNKATFVIADTDVRSFKKRQGIKYFLFGQELTHGLGTGLNTDLARESAEIEKERISQLFKDQDIVIFITCLGGGLGSGATQVFLDAAKNFGGITLGIFTLPFKFEGRNKQRIAAKAQKELRRALNVSITIPNEKIFKIIDENTAIVEAFSMVNKNLIESLESLIELIQSPGLINIDFADLRAILQGSGNLAFLNTAQAAGKDKADIVIKDVLHNPLYQDHFIPDKVLFNIEGSKSLSMFEVDKISKAISEKNPKAKIIFGISKNQKYKNRIKTTLLMTGPSLVADVNETDKANEVLVKKDSTKIVKVKKVKTKKNKNRTKSNVIDKKNSVLDNFIPVFSNNLESEKVQRISIMEEVQTSKKPLRRNALEIKKAEEIEKSKKSKQEEEWEIPAFLRFKKVK